ncbi:hypothetical protein GLAREA_04855 [Glarea lozoyensis ATCC 20868]|uniref:Uncharacterized protein n=1 Tax=Glarea lozoyensis (strain ATCC 20868 / MF5171) TaxID=1116229 RepID=S3CSL4_GLAL2|nr:uncharacterized protein GLAREA_04855 [Glarea lozoyensis ATCC 20868]EPE28064.1 hypothetical protein GLAREA_04855 [Glarea lozoyensis ATCC 20868]
MVVLTNSNWNAVTRGQVFPITWNDNVGLEFITLRNTTADQQLAAGQLMNPFPWPVPYNISTAEFFRVIITDDRNSSTSPKFIPVAILPGFQTIAVPSPTTTVFESPSTLSHNLAPPTSSIATGNNQGHVPSTNDFGVSKTGLTVMFLIAISCIAFTAFFVLLRCGRWCIRRKSSNSKEISTNENDQGETPPAGIKKLFKSSGFRKPELCSTSQQILEMGNSKRDTISELEARRKTVELDEDIY